METRISKSAWLADADLPSAAALAGRVCLTGIFLISGIGKLLAPYATLAFITSAGLPLPRLGLIIAVCIELIGSASLLAGYRVRWAAGVLAVYCIVTAIAFHAHFADQNQLEHFWKNVAIAGGLLNVAALGSGRYGLDARRVV